MRARLWLVFLSVPSALGAGCSSTNAAPEGPTVRAEASVDASAVVMSAPTAMPSAAASSTVDLDAPLSGPPRLVLANRSDADIQLYRGFLVDEEGKRGTVSLWPRASECPNEPDNARALPRRGSLDLPAPATEYDVGRCAPGEKLPPGRYLVRIESGYGNDLFAGGPITLPLGAPVRLDMVTHEDPPACTPLRARRAARLLLAEAREVGVRDELVKACDPTAARCGTLPLPEDEVLPERCTLTLHEQLLRVRFPPDEGNPKELSAWFDHDIVAADRPELSRSTGAAFRLGGARVVVEGVTSQHMHEHGGDAARIGSMKVRIHNGSARTLPLKAVAVDWLSDHGCGTPQPNANAPRVLGVEPVQVPPGDTDVEIRFDAKSAYQAYCDIFASRATLELAGQTVRVVSEHHVTRIEPLRERP